MTDQRHGEPPRRLAAVEDRHLTGHTPATRCFQRYDSETRAMHAASHRLSRSKRDAVGEFFYVHPMVPGVAFSTAKDATTRAHAIFAATLRIDETAMRLRIAPLGDATLEAEAEAASIAESALPPLQSVVRQ